GRLPEALAAVQKGLDSRKTRSVWYGTAADVFDAAGRHADAQTLLREWLDVEEKARAKAGTGGWDSKWRRSWTIAGIYSRLGDGAQAGEAMAAAGDPPEGMYIDSILWMEVPVLVPLHEWDRAADMIRSREKASRYDVCGHRDLEPLRADPRYADLFAKCAHIVPPRATTASAPRRH